MSNRQATAKPCEHNHGTNFNWETKAVYDNGQMLCWDCNQIYTPEPQPQTYDSLVNERSALLQEVSRLKEALSGLRGVVGDPRCWCNPKFANVPACHTFGCIAASTALDGNKKGERE